MSSRTAAKERSAPARLMAGISIPAVFGLGLIAQPAGAVITISPSPSYTGSYTVSWNGPLGCSVYYDMDGFPWDICFTLTEHQGGANGPVTGSWTSGSSLNVSGKSAGTYTYKITGHWYSWYWGSFTQTADGPVSVQVILPLPDPNSYYQQTSGPANNPQSYQLVWNATNATSCELLISWWRAGDVVPSHQDGGPVGTSGVYPYIIKYWSNLDYVRARTTCHGPGGSNYEEWFIDFNQSAVP